MNKIEIIGHRGARAYAPENTLPGYKVALEQHVDMVDMDVVLTKDKVWIAYHDLMVNPDILCDVDGKILDFYLRGNEQQEYGNENSTLKYFSANIDKYLIKNITFDELQHSYRVKLNSNSAYAKWFPKQQSIENTPIPSLQEVADYVNAQTANKMSFQIEIKNDFERPEYTESPEILAKLMYDFLVKNNLIMRVKIQAFDWRILYALNQLDPRIKTAYLVDSAMVAKWQQRFAHSPIIQQIKRILKLEETESSDHDCLSSATLLKVIKELGGYSYEPEDNELQYADVVYAHQLGLKVYVWGWPEHAGFAFNPDLVRTLAIWDIDGFITDDPLMLYQILHPATFPTKQL